MKDLLVEDKTSQALLTHKITLKNDACEVIVCKETFTTSRAIFGSDVVFIDNDLPCVEKMTLLQKNKIPVITKAV